MFVWEISRDLHDLEPFDLMHRGETGPAFVVLEHHNAVQVAFHCGVDTVDGFQRLEVAADPASMSALRSAGLIAPVITDTVSAMLMTLGFRMAARLPIR